MSICIGSPEGTCSRCKHFARMEWVIPTNFCKLHGRAVVKFWCCERFEPKEEHNENHD